MEIRLSNIHVILLIFTFFPLHLHGQKNIDLTLESAVNIALNNSYRVRQLRLGIERTRTRLKVQRTGLKSRAYVNLRAPEFKAISDYKWNSTLQRDEIVRQNIRLWQMNLAIRQPVVLFGYPTNGYLSLNNKLYRYLQRDGTHSLNYYNRYFLEFEQPLFKPNRLRNDIEQAELELQRRELEYIDDLVDMIRDIADDYYRLFQLTYRNKIYSSRVKNLEQILMIAESRKELGEPLPMEVSQVKIEIANAREQLLENQSIKRMEYTRMKQRLRLDKNDSIFVDIHTHFAPVKVDITQAIEYGYNLRPRLKLLRINERRNEINLENTKGINSFGVDVQMSYGLEKQDEEYQELWSDHNNSYSVSVNAYIPLWDWGQREARIEAGKINLKMSRLTIERSREEINTEIKNAVSNLREYQKRALSMRENMDMAQEISAISIEKYRKGEITIQNLLQNIARQRVTELNFLKAYLGYRHSLLNLMVNTYYDFENDKPLIEQFGLKETVVNKKQYRL